MSECSRPRTSRRFWFRSNLSVFWAKPWQFFIQFFVAGGSLCGSTWILDGDLPQEPLSKDFWDVQYGILRIILQTFIMERSRMEIFCWASASCSPREVFRVGSTLHFTPKKNRGNGLMTSVLYVIALFGSLACIILFFQFYLKCSVIFWSLISRWKLQFNDFKCFWHLKFRPKQASCGSYIGFFPRFRLSVLDGWCLKGFAHFQLWAQRKPAKTKSGNLLLQPQSHRAFLMCAGVSLPGLFYGCFFTANGSTVDWILAC